LLLATVLKKYKNFFKIKWNIKRLFINLNFKLREKVVSIVNIKCKSEILEKIKNKCIKLFKILKPKLIEKILKLNNLDKKMLS
jgi:hypothetical protein